MSSVGMVEVDYAQDQILQLYQGTAPTQYEALHFKTEQELL